ncbi:hypothetical protein CTAYLR_001783, partial [Chrysophaeum taylorii]
MQNDERVLSVKKVRLKAVKSAHRSATCLDFSFLPMTSSDVDEIFQGLREQRLVDELRVDMRDCGLDDRAAESLGRLVGLGLKEVLLDGNNLTNAGVVIVAAGLRGSGVASFARNVRVSFPETTPLPEEIRPRRRQLRFSIGICAPHAATNGVFAFVRFRPESGDADVETEFFEGKYALRLGERRPARFDHVLTSDSAATPEDLVDGVAQKAFAGYSTAIMAYGGTGSGKTFTIDALRRAVTASLAEEATRERARCALVGRNFDASCKFSLIEVYNEKLYDLTTNKEFRLRIVKDPVTGAHALDMKGLSQKHINMCGGPPDAVLSAALDVIRSGERNRRTAATAMNNRSSRAHCIFKIEVRHALVDFLVDLAGNENISVHDGKKDKETRMRETKSINKSLLALGQVVAFTAEKPKSLSAKEEETYSGAIRSKCRDSQLTLLLNQAFGGKNMSVLFGCCRQELSGPTINTLDFAAVFQSLDNKPVAEECHETNWELLARLLMDQLVFVYDSVFSLGRNKRRPLLVGFDDAVRRACPDLYDANADVAPHCGLAFDHETWATRSPTKRPTSDDTKKHRHPFVRASSDSGAASFAEEGDFHSVSPMDEWRSRTSVEETPAPSPPDEGRLTIDVLESLDKTPDDSNDNIINGSEQEAAATESIGAHRSTSPDSSSEDPEDGVCVAKRRLLDAKDQARLHDQAYQADLLALLQRIADSGSADGANLLVDLASRIGQNRRIENDGASTQKLQTTEAENASLRAKIATLEEKLAKQSERDRAVERFEHDSIRAGTAQTKRKEDQDLAASVLKVRELDAKYSKLKGDHDHLKQENEHLKRQLWQLQKRAQSLEEHRHPTISPSSRRHSADPACLAKTEKPATRRSRFCAI